MGAMADRNRDHPADLGVCHPRLLVESLAAVLSMPKLAIRESVDSLCRDGRDTHIV